MYNTCPNWLKNTPQFKSLPERKTTRGRIFKYCPLLQKKFFKF